MFIQLTFEELVRKYNFSVVVVVVVVVVTSAATAETVMMSLSGELPPSSQVQLHDETVESGTGTGTRTGTSRLRRESRTNSSSIDTATESGSGSGPGPIITTRASIDRAVDPASGTASTSISMTVAASSSSSSAVIVTATGGGGGGGGSNGSGSGRRGMISRNEEDEISTVSPSLSASTKKGMETGHSVGHEGLTGDIGNIEDVSSIQPGSSVTRVYKKCASNGSLAVYVGTRTLIVTDGHLEPLKGVLVFDQESLVQNISSDFRIWGQITLTFRYGREDEEVLGLRFCNEAILALKQLWPPMSRDPDDPDDEDEELTPLQTVLLERVRSSATSDSIKSVPFVLCGGPVGLGSFPPPPSVLLAPAKPYRGSPIGTIYDLRIYASENPQERPPRRNLIRLALRAVQMPCTNVPFERKGTLETRPTFLSRGKIRFAIELSQNAVRYGESLEVKVLVQNNSRSSIRRVLVSLIQQVDVCMFTSGKFKNTVGCADDQVLIVPGASLQKRYTLTPTRGPARQWLALEEAFGRDPVLAPSTILDNPFGKILIAPSQQANARNVFAIIVSYYVKAKLVLGGLTGLGQCVIKVPFVLLPPENAEPDPYPQLEQPTTTIPVPIPIPVVPPGGESAEEGEPSNPSQAVCTTTTATSSATRTSITTTTAAVTVERHKINKDEASSPSSSPRESPHHHQQQQHGTEKNTNVFISSTHPNNDNSDTAVSEMMSLTTITNTNTNDSPSKTTSSSS